MVIRRKKIIRENMIVRLIRVIVVIRVNEVIALLVLSKSFELFGILG